MHEEIKKLISKQKEIGVSVHHIETWKNLKK